MYFKCIKDEHIIITVSVDDMAVTSQHLRHITLFKLQLQDHFEITDLGELNWLLGLKVEHDRLTCTITLSQAAYVNTILEQFNLTAAKSVQTPMDISTLLSMD